MHGQQPEATPPADAQAPAAQPPASASEPQPPAPAASPADDIPGGEDLPPRRPEDRALPRLDVYFPEGDLDLRINRLINEVFFEGQVKYNFIKGDITAFLRYRYYGFRRTTQLTVFDSIEFDDIDEEVTDDFDRVRGILTLFQWPHSYNHRTSFLAELDRVSTNKPDEIDRLEQIGETNTFIRYSYQVGTPEDGRSNAIVGEPRARTERLFSAFREIGPGGAGFTAAVSYGFPYGIGDFDYVKLEMEALKRFDLTARSFLVGRLRGGTFPKTGSARPAPNGQPEEPDSEDTLRVPRPDFFHLDGRESLKGLSDRRVGTETLLTTWELFLPWFIEARHRFMKLEWENWYWILYAGLGTIGFDREVYSNFDGYVPDTGIGFESSFRLRKYRFFLSGIVAQALKGDGGVEARISVKSYR